jgi:TolB-like protein/thioredoxin-like negative regulator of GroEL
MAVLYAVAAWLIVQVAGVLIDLAKLPHWIGTTTLWLLAVGFPIALIFSWFYEITPEGISLEKDIDPEGSITQVTGRRLDFIVISLLCAAVILFAYDKWWITPPTELSIAVLPFVDMSPQHDQQYFAEGLTVELLNTLSRNTDLRVTGRTSAFQFKDHEGDFRAIGKTLGVGTILEGSVRTTGDRMRITTQLVDAHEGHTLWSANYDREITNVFQVQDEITRAVVEALQAKLLKGEPDPARRIVNSEAYKANQQGKYLQGLATVDSQNQAIDYFNKARQIDPAFAEPLVGLANANLMLALNMSAIDRNLGFGRASGFLEEALRLNPNQADAYVARALIKQIKSRDYIGAEIDLKRAVEIVPSNITALRRLGTIHGYYGRYDEAMSAFQAIIDRDPLNTQTYSNYSMNALAAGDVALAERTIKKVLEFKPDSTYANYQLSRVLLAQGNIEQAKLANERETLPVWKTIGDGMIACIEGDRERAVAIAEGLIEQREIFNAAEIYGLCGDTDRVFELLNRAAKDSDPALIEMKLSWQLAYLRDDPRWHQVLVKIGLTT